MLAKSFVLGIVYILRQQPRGDLEKQTDADGGGRGSGPC